MAWFDALKDKTEQLIDRSEMQRVQLIESEFTFAQTCCDLIDTEIRLGNVEHARRLVDKIHSALATAKRYLAQAKIPPEQCAEMSRQLEEVESRLQELMKQVA